MSVRSAALITALLVFALPAAAQEPSADEKALFDNCMRTSNSTDAFCRCGVEHYKSALTKQELSLVAALSNQVAAGQSGGLDTVAADLGMTPEQKDEAIKRVAGAAKGAADTCDPMIEKKSDQ